MLQDFAIRIQNTKTNRISIMEISAIDLEMALSIASDVTSEQPDLVVLGF